MNDSEIQQRVDELDAAVKKDDAKMLVYVEPDDGSCEFVGNRQGYLRAGIEMLRAAIVPLGANESITPIEVGYLFGERSLTVRRLKRREDIDTARTPADRPFWPVIAFVLGGWAVFIFFCYLRNRWVRTRDCVANWEMIMTFENILLKKKTRLLTSPSTGRR